MLTKPTRLPLRDDPRLQYIIGNPSCVYWEGERIATKVAADILICLVLCEGDNVRPSAIVRRVGCDLTTVKVLMSRLRKRLNTLNAAFNISDNRTGLGWRLMRFDNGVHR